MNTPEYFLIITYPGSGLQHLMKGEKAIAATEENKHLLYVMGDKLLDENVIGSYQMVKIVEPEVNHHNKLTERILRNLNVE